MHTCVIFCAGEFAGLAQPVDSTDYLLAADGGLVHLEKLGLCPQAVIGDFDSLGYVPQGAQVFPVEKDDTDAMLAVRRGLALGYRRFVIYGGMDGPRLDHTLANLQTLSYLAQHGARGYLAGNRYMALCLKNGTVTFDAGAKGIVSLFCMGPEARGVTVTGLQYSMEKGVLTSDFPLGVSNHFAGQPSSVTVEDGTLLILYDVENGFPTGD